MSETISGRRFMELTAEAPIRILGIGGSMRANSQSLMVLKAALSLAENAGAQTVLADVRALDLPLYDPDRPLDSYPATLSWLIQEARAADAYMLCSPTYHGTISGSLKNVLDALEFLGQDTPPYFGHKVVGLIGLGGGAHNVINSLHHAARTLNGLVAPTVVAIPHGVVDAKTGQISDADISRRLQQLVAQTIDLARRLKQHDA
jgi:FMN reductase